MAPKVPCGRFTRRRIAGLVHIYSKVIRSYLDVFRKNRFHACGKQIKPVFLSGESRAALSAFGFFVFICSSFRFIIDKVFSDVVKFRCMQFDSLYLRVREDYGR